MLLDVGQRAVKGEISEYKPIEFARDVAPFKNLFATIYGFDTRRHAKDETLAWLLWYNQSRLHSTLNYLSPMQFEQHWLADQIRQANS